MFFFIIVINIKNFLFIKGCNLYLSSNILLKKNSGDVSRSIRKQLVVWSIWVWFLEHCLTVHSVNRSIRNFVGSRAGAKGRKRRWFGIPTCSHRQPFSHVLQLFSVRKRKVLATNKSSSKNSPIAWIWLVRFDGKQIWMAHLGPKHTLTNWWTWEAVYYYYYSCHTCTWQPLQYRSRLYWFSFLSTFFAQSLLVQL